MILVNINNSILFFFSFIYIWLNLLPHDTKGNIFQRNWHVPDLSIVHALIANDK